MDNNRIKALKEDPNPLKGRISTNLGNKEVEYHQAMENVKESLNIGSVEAMNSTSYFSKENNFNPFSMGNAQANRQMNQENLDQNEFFKKMQGDAYFKEDPMANCRNFSSSMNLDLSFRDKNISDAPMKEGFFEIKENKPSQPRLFSKEPHQIKEDQKSHTFKQKENDLDLLINSAVKLIEEGLHLGNLKSLRRKSTTLLKRKPNSFTLKIQPSQEHEEHSSPSTDSNFKCGNRICPVIFTKKSNLFHAYISSIGKSVFLCNLCYQAFKNGQYCYYCGIIYRKYKGTKGFNNHKTWIGCEYCSNWEHVQCEEIKGVFHNLSKIIKKDKKFKYKCPSCRNEEYNCSRKCSLTKDDSNEFITQTEKMAEFQKGKNKDDKENEFKKKVRRHSNFDENSFEVDKKYKHVRMDDEKKELLDDIKQIMDLDNE